MAKITLYDVDRLDDTTLHYVDSLLEAELDNPEVPKESVYTYEWLREMIALLRKEAS